MTSRYPQQFRPSGLGAITPEEFDTWFTTKQVADKKYLAMKPAVQVLIPARLQGAVIVGEWAGPGGAKVVQVAKAPEGGKTPAAFNLLAAHKEAGDGVLFVSGGEMGFSLLFTRDLGLASKLTMDPQNVDPYVPGFYAVLHEPSGGWKSGGTEKLLFYGGAALGVAMLAWALWPMGELTPNLRRRPTRGNIYDVAVPLRGRTWARITVSRGPGRDAQYVLKLRDEQGHRTESVYKSRRAALVMANKLYRSYAAGSMWRS